MKFALPPSTKNWLSLAGATVALVSLFMIVFLFAATALLEQRATYIGLVIYILLPGVMILGLLFIPIGMVVKIRRERRAGIRPDRSWPHIDLNDVRQRNGFFVFAIGSGLFLFLSAIGSYETFHYTESTAFCGGLCHTVMHPEYIAYQNSPHARVPCVDCHVGPGADWYVRSKFSGLYQVYATLMDKYPRPIPAPIEHLRPAREVCEQCHWAAKAYAHNLKLNVRYLSDRAVTRWQIHMNLKLSAPVAALGLIEGIHWHNNRHVRIEYAAADRKRTVIPWVRYTNLKTGEIREYAARGAGQKEPAAGREVRIMDCMDCHNRPSHRFLSPSRFIDAALAAGAIPAVLPQIKAAAVSACAREYSSAPAALQGIGEEIRAFYQKKYPDVLEEKGALVEQAVAATQEAFARNIFPEMNARWSAYPDFNGHLEFAGCFRCHGGRHAAADGKVIPAGCTLCHDILAQGKPGEMETAKIGESLPFRHPVEIGGLWRDRLCHDCHRGLIP